MFLIPVESGLPVSVSFSPLWSCRRAEAGQARVTAEGADHCLEPRCKITDVSIVFVRFVSIKIVLILVTLMTVTKCH